MGAGRGSAAGAIARATALGLGLVALLSCGRGDLPTNITSLAVLPADVAPYHQMTERAVGDYLTQALNHTSFRVVGAESARRVLSGPRAQDLYRRFRDQAKTSPEVALLVTQGVADTVNAQGLLFPQLAVTVVGPVEGRMALTVSIFDRYTGRRVWRNRRERSFVGRLGDPGFLQAVKAMADELVATMPQPSEEGGD